MTFTQFKNLPISSKITLCEFSVPAFPANFDIFLNYEAGIWVCAITPGVVIVRGIDDSGFYKNQNIKIFNDITGFIVDSVNEYSKTFSISELRLQNKGYWYDKAGVSIGCPAVLVHFDKFGEPLNKTIQLKQVYGFCTKSDSDPLIGAYFNGTYYEPLIKNIPTISKSKDPLYYGIMTFQGGSVSFDNEPKDGKGKGFFDDFKELNLYRTPVKLKFGFDGLPYDEFYQVFTGYVENYDSNFSGFTVKLQDKRKGLTEKIPKNVFTLTEFPFIDENNINTPKPIGFGNVLDAPLICINEKEENPIRWLYYLSDTEFSHIYSVTAVRCADEIIASSYYTINYSTGILSINPEAVIDKETEISCDFCPRNIHNSHELAKTLLLDFGDIVFNNNYFNVSEWDEAQAIARTVQIYITEPTDIKAILEKCADASDSVIFPMDDGRYTSRVYREDRAIRRTISNDEWINDPTIANDPNQFLSSVAVKYNPKWKDKSYTTFLNKRYEADARVKYKGENFKEFETIIATEAGAIAKSESVMLFSKNIPDIVKRKTKSQNIDLEVMDFVACLPSRRYNEDEEIINEIWEVLAPIKNLSTAETELTLRFVKDFIPFPDKQYRANGDLWTGVYFDVNNKNTYPSSIGLSNYNQKYSNVSTYGYTGFYLTQIFCSSEANKIYTFKSNNGQAVIFSRIYNHKNGSYTNWKKEASGQGNHSITVNPAKNNQFVICFDANDWNNIDTGKIFIKNIIKG